MMMIIIMIMLMMMMIIIISIIMIVVVAAAVVVVVVVVPVVVIVPVVVVVVIVALKDTLACWDVKQASKQPTNHIACFLLTEGSSLQWCVRAPPYICTTARTVHTLTL